MVEVVMITGAISRAKLQSNHHHQKKTNTKFFTGRMPFLSPNQQCQSTEGKNITFHTTMWKVSGQLYSFTIQLIYFIVMKKCLITINAHEGCYFFALLHRLIYQLHHVFKMSAFGTYACFKCEYHCSMDASIVRCSMLCQTFIFITENIE